MRRTLASFRRARPPRRFGAVLALVALLVQLALPGTAALAMGRDALGLVPICTGGSARDAGPEAPRKALHAACPLCQAPSAVWGFVLPPAPAALQGPYSLGRVVWRYEAATGMPATIAGSRARGPPGAA
jgi:hypothetical protein